MYPSGVLLRDAKSNMYGTTEACPEQQKQLPVQLEDSANSTHQGVSFTLNRRMSNELEFSASYTLSKTFDDASYFKEQRQNPFDLAAERAPSLQHRIVHDYITALRVNGVAVIEFKPNLALEGYGVKP